MVYPTDKIAYVLITDRLIKVKNVLRLAYLDTDKLRRYLKIL